MCRRPAPERRGGSLAEELLIAAACAGATLTELGLAPGHLVCVDAAQPAVAALHAMRTAQLSIMGVLATPDGPLVGGACRL